MATAGIVLAEWATHKPKGPRFLSLFPEVFINMSVLIEFAQSLQDSQFGTALAESRYVFPLVEAVHLLGLSVSVGLIFLTDLRLIGLLLKGVTVPVLLRQLRPWVLGGFAATFISGVLLFIAEGATVIVSPAFPAKFLFIALAGLNALYFEFRLAGKTLSLSAEAALPTAIKFAGVASITLWTLVIIAGRLIPYLPG